MRQLGNRRDYDNLILACDVGGTNTSVALVGRIGTRFDILKKVRYPSQKLDSMQTGLQRAAEEMNSLDREHRPDRICISGAGPVRDNTCKLTNLSWTIDGNAIAEAFGIPTLVINDFSAISYGIPLLDVDDPEQITPIPLPDGTIPAQYGPVQAVVGAGTGLGIGYLVEHDSRFIALPSEGGHGNFAPYDSMSAEMREYLSTNETAVPGAELFVSGQGIAWTYRFFRDTHRISSESPLAHIAPSSENGNDIAASVSAAAAEGDRSAADIMRLFVRNYAHVASDAALHFLPTNGFFLAGGIVTKNERWFLEENCFSREFVKNYHDHISELLEGIPVFIVKDYAISLYGAAHAAYALTIKE